MQISLYMEVDGQLCTCWRLQKTKSLGEKNKKKTLTEAKKSMEDSRFTNLSKM